jgi:hypothetical protein
VTTNRPQSLRRGVRRFLRGVLGVLIGLGAIASYFIFTGMFDAVPNFHAMTLTWLFVVVLSLVGAAIWIRDERRHQDDDGDGDE